MTEPVFSQLVGSRGPINSGSGPQYNFGPWPTDPKGRSPRRQAADHLRELAQRFVYPAGFGKARESLRTYRTVFLYAPHGSGKSATAQLLLRELAAPDDSILQLQVQDKDSDHYRPIDFTHIGDGDYVWLDLADTGGWSRSEIRNEFSELRFTVGKRGACLVAILGDQEMRFYPEIANYCVRIDRPQLHDVLQRHLRMAGFPASESLDELEFTRQGGPLGGVPEYVQLIIEAKERAASEGDFLKWCATAYRALTGSVTEARDLINKRTDGAPRALLLTVAMLHGAHADIVDQAAGALLSGVGHPPDDSSVLERPALDQQLDEIEAERDSAGNVHFRILGFDSAVRSYFWMHMPGLRKSLRDWLETVLDADNIKQTERDRLITNFAGLCLTERYRPILTDLAEKYTSQDAKDSRIAAAILILQCGLHMDNCGRTFRRKIYDWATSQNISDRREAVIVAACCQEIVTTHPDEALVRLHHVARRKKGGVAYQALVELASTDRRSLRQILGRLTYPEPDARRWDADPGIFIDIADPVILTDPGERNRPLIAERAAFEQLVVGWKLVFSNLGYEVWSPRVHHWLEHAAENEKHRHTLLDVLVLGGAQSADVLARIYAMTCVAEFRGVIGDLVLEKITVAQGVEFTWTTAVPIGECHDG